MDIKVVLKSCDLAFLHEKAALKLHNERRRRRRGSVIVGRPEKDGDCGSI